MALDQAWILFFLIPFIGVGLVVLGFISRKKKTKTKVQYVSNSSAITQTPNYRAAFKRYRIGVIVLLVAMVTSLLGLSVVASKPVLVETTTPTKYNRDIVLCLDVSGSMIDVDYEIVKKFEELVDEFKGERVGLVTWNSTSHMVFPLTDDYDYIKENLRSVANFFKPGEIGDSNEDFYDLSKYTLNGAGGSLIGDGLTACSLAFDREVEGEDRSKSIILATDNVINGEPFVTLEEATQYATDQDITIYGIRPTTGWEVADEAGEMRSYIENINGGSFYELENAESTEDIVNQITKEEATAIDGSPVVTKTDNPTLWIFLVSGLIIVATGLAWRFKV